MLEFKKPEQIKPEPVKEGPPTPRWPVGVERKNVAAYVTLALIAGFALGFVVSRLLVQPQPRTPALAETTETATEPPVAPTEYHRVTRIIRADTLEVEGIGAVRLIGVETPDGKQPKESYQVHGDNALAFVEKAVLNQPVRLEYDPANQNTGNKDELGQTLAYVYTQVGIMINAELVRIGLGFVRGFEQFEASNDFRMLERDALRESRGVWGGLTAPMDEVAAASSGSGNEKSRPKLSPLPPSAFGANIPAVTGSSGTSASTPDSPSEPTVLVSSADRSYHKSGCERLESKKKRSLGVSQARSEGYTACSRCFASTVLKAP
jgi:micrococcal nuclease